MQELKKLLMQANLMATEVITKAEQDGDIEMVDLAMCVKRDLIKIVNNINRVPREIRRESPYRPVECKQEIL